MLDQFHVCCKVIELNIYKLLFFFRFFSYLCVLIHFSHVGLFVTPWTVAHQAPLSMGFSRQEYWLGCHALLQGIFLTQGFGLASHVSSALQTDSLPLSHQGSLNFCLVYYRILSRVPCAIQQTLLVPVNGFLNQVGKSPSFPSRVLFLLGEDLDYTGLEGKKQLLSIFLVRRHSFCLFMARLKVLHFGRILF